MKKPLTIGVITNPTIAKTKAALKKLHSVADSLGIHILDESDSAEPDFYVVLGGDGSVLRAIHTVSNNQIPFVSINIGSLGYLTCAEFKDVKHVLQALLNQNYVISSRSMVRAQCATANGVPIGKRVFALNDLVALRGESGRTVGITISINDITITEFICDGLIIATPTGSTAYSLSAGGPIVIPETRVLTLNVICPHTLTSRPLVLPDTAKIKLTISRAATNLSFSADGQVSTPLNLNDTVEIQMAKRKVNLVMLPGHNHFTALNQKLGWSGTLLK